MGFDWFDLLVLFGILQGLITAGLLLRNFTATPIPIKLLATILVVFSLLSFKIVLHTAGWWHTIPLRYFPLGIDLLIQPLLYLYAVSVVQPDFRWATSRWWHFLPPLCFFLHALLVYGAVWEESDLGQKDIIAEQWHYNSVKAIEDYLSVASAIAYGLLGFRVIQQYRKVLGSDRQYRTISWLNTILIATALLGVGVFINLGLDQFFKFNAHHFFHWQLFYIYLSSLIYYIAFRSYRDQDGINNRSDRNPKSAIISRYSPEELQQAKQAIVKALEEDRLFLNSELTLQTLAVYLKISPSLLSETINKELGKSFRTLINDLRVEEVKGKLTPANLAKSSILGLALECGFNSEASFYRIFKAATGVSPKSYVDRINDYSATSKSL